MEENRVGKRLDTKIGYGYNAVIANNKKQKRKENPNMPGIKEVAKQANILIATVSRVLSKPETVAKETIKKTALMTIS